MKIQANIHHAKAEKYGRQKDGTPGEIKRRRAKDWKEKRRSRDRTAKESRRINNG